MSSIKSDDRTTEAAQRAGMCAFMQGQCGTEHCPKSRQKDDKNSVLFSDVCSCGGYLTTGKALHVADEGTDPERITE